jgi:hypothetical protein
MKLDLKHLTPINSSILFTVISFIIFFLTFLIIKPSFVMEISKNKDLTINYFLLLSYSLMFSIVIGFIIVFFKLHNKMNTVDTKMSTVDNKISTVDNKMSTVDNKISSVDNTKLINYVPTYIN